MSFTALFQPNPDMGIGILIGGLIFLLCQAMIRWQRRRIAARRKELTFRMEFLEKSFDSLESHVSHLSNELYTRTEVKMSPRKTAKRHRK